MATALARCAWVAHPRLAGLQSDERDVSRHQEERSLREDTGPEAASVRAGRGLLPSPVIFPGAAKGLTELPQPRFCQFWRSTFLDVSPDS
jgi:hypothetical protein